MLSWRWRDVPVCRGLLPKTVTDATMYPYSTTMNGMAETSKRDLSDDDVRAVCDVYPTSGPATACYDLVQAGCAVGRRRWDGSVALALLLVIAVTAAATAARRC